MRYLVGFVLLLLALGTLRTVGCGEAESPCWDCSDGNPCTEGVCTYDIGAGFSCDPSEREPEDYYCDHRRRPDGAPCGSGNVCVRGVCGENLCAGCVDDGNQCTEHCDYETGACNEPLWGKDCRGEASYGRCSENGVCIVCLELDCDDGDLCTYDGCHDGSGCFYESVHCRYCSECDPETGECSDTLGDGNHCPANDELGIGGEYLIGSCESGRCTGQTCDVTSDEVYPCPLEWRPSPGEPMFCCPWEHLPEYPRGYCTTHAICVDARCSLECPGAYSVCQDQEGVCP